jgi:adenylate kinase
MIIVLFGKPGGGKGTQAPLLAAALDVPTLATGDELRAAVRDRTPMGLAAKAAMERGELVPDTVILGILKDALSGPRFAKGAVLDGVVRTVPQAEGLNAMLADLGRKLDAVLYFDIADDVLVQRLSGRTVCEKCQTPYQGREPGTRCDKADGGLLVRRKDDEPEAVRLRLAVYERDTAPVLAWYKANGVPVATVDAVGSVADVTRRALQAVGL